MMVDGPATAEERNGRLQPILNVPRVVVGLIIVLFVIHLIRWLADEQILMRSDAVFSFSPAKITGKIAESWPGEVFWSFLSYAFLHGSWPHLLFNCLWMVVFGSVAARRLGAVRFLLLSAFSVIAGAAAMLLIYWNEQLYMIGASAAVSGQMAAAVPLMYGQNAGPRLVSGGDLSRVQALSPRRLFTDRRPLIFMGVLLAIMLLTGTTDVLAGGEAVNIAWQAHIGGFIAGLIVFYLLDQGPVA